MSTEHPRVLHAVALLVSSRRQDPLPEVDVAGEGGVVGRRDHLAQQVDGGSGTRSRQQVAVRLRELPLEINALELGREGVQDGLTKFIEMALVSEDGMQVRPAPAGRRCLRHGDRQEPRLEGPLRPWADDGRAEANRGDVPFTDTPY